MAGDLEFWWTFRIYEAHAVVVSCSLSRRRGGSWRIWTTSNCEVVTLEHQPSNNKYTATGPNCERGNEYQMKGRMPWFKLNRQQRTASSINMNHERPRQSFCFDCNSNHPCKSLVRIEIWNFITVNKSGSVDKYLCLDCHCLALNDASLCSTTK